MWIQIRLSVLSSSCPNDYAISVRGYYAESIHYTENIPLVRL